MMLVRALGVGALLVLGACAGSGGDDSLVASSSPPTTIEITPTSAPTVPEPDTQPDDQPLATAAPTVVESTTTTPESVDTGEPFGETWGLPDVVQITPLAGGGPRPLFEWEPTEGADGYMLWVYSPDGRPYWSWLGPDTNTYLGGAIQLADDRPGPRVIDGMTWVVAAVDNDLEYLAVSEQRWIGP